MKGWSEGSLVPSTLQPSVIDLEMSRASLMQALRQGTAIEHKAVEQSLKLMRDDVSLDDVRAYLLLMWRVHVNLESQLGDVPRLAQVLPDLDQRRRLALTEQALLSLGVSGAQLDAQAPRVELPRLRDVETALGALYVLEGSTLGGRIIRRHLEALLGAQCAGALAYLMPYSDLSEMWKRFGAAVDAYGKSHPQSVPRIVAAAVSVFQGIQRHSQRAHELP